MNEPRDTTPAPHAAGHKGPRWQTATRLVLGAGLLVALLIIALNTRAALDDAGVARSLVRIGRLRLAEPAAINAALIYAQAAFQALVAIGVAVAGYILTRARD